MSVILDVLRKLDREKPSRRNETPNIAVEILRPDLPRSGRRILLYVGMISFTAIATAVITFGLMKEFEFLSKSSTPVPVNPPAPGRQVEPAPLESGVQTKSLPLVPVSPPVSSQKIAPAPLSREPVRETKEDISKAFPKTETPPESKVSGETKVSIESKPITVPPDEKKTSQSVIPEKKEVVPGGPSRKSTETPASESAANPPSIKLSAIVWYENPSMRFAIVNDLKAVEGSLIEGVKVVEIHPTRVRFLHNNQYFEVSILR
jgi:hypothetical protein